MLTRYRQVWAYNLVQDQDRLIKAKHEAANDRLDSMMHRRRKVDAGDWVWVYDDKSMISVGGGGRAEITGGTTAKKKTIRTDI